MNHNKRVWQWRRKQKDTDNGKQLIMMMALLMVLVMVGSAFFIYRMVLANTDAGPVKKPRKNWGRGLN